MDIRRSLCLAVLLLAAGHAWGQDTVVGSVDGGFGAHNIANATFINSTDSATADGTVTTAVARFGFFPPCSGSFRVRFYHSNSDGLAMIAERGPFPIDARTKVVDLTPPVDLLKGDIVGIYQQTDGRCGIAATYGGGNDVALRVDADFRGGALANNYSVSRRFRYAIRASSQKMVLAGVIPAVGSATGAFGSQFRTSFQISNPDNEEVLQGLKFVYHPRGTASSGDPSASIDLGSNATSAADLIRSLNVDGVGSLDVYTPVWPPVMSARVYNDTGSGTNGFSEPLIPVARTLHGGEHARIVFPADLANYRMNVGIRTLGSPVTLNCIQWDAAGTSKGSSSVTYAANTFDQIGLAAFAPAAVSEGGSISFQVIGGGDVIVYTTITDNRTNDSAMTIVSRD